MPKFTKQHYEAIADVLAQQENILKLNKEVTLQPTRAKWLEGYDAAIHDITLELGEMFGEDNPRFSYATFALRALPIFFAEKANRIFQKIGTKEYIPVKR
jgi:hypothetical protein